MAVRKPNFFIVGAPKCGTTAMDSYLAQHPKIYMSPVKELHFFGSDLDYRKQLSFTEADYNSHFISKNDESIIGESSVFYLYSKTSALEIFDYAPDAKILIMLRNPVDAIQSYHSQLLYQSDEDIVDLEKAITAQERRKRGEDLPRLVSGTFKVFYSDVFCYAEQVRRYLDCFPPKNIKILLYEDFAKQTERVYVETLEFLEVDSCHRPDFTVVNANKASRSRALSDFLRCPPKWLYPIARTLPRPWIQHLKQQLWRANARKVKRKPLTPTQRKALTAYFDADVGSLEFLLQRPLRDVWSDFDGNKLA